MFLWKVKRFHGRDGRPYSNSGKQAGEDQANTFSAALNEECPLQSWTSHQWFQCSHPTQAWPWKCKKSFQMFGWEERSILLQNLLYAALVFSSGGTFWAAPGPGQPWKHNFCLAESWGWAWWSTSSSGNPQAAAARQHNLRAAKKPLFTTIPNIINQPTVCSDRKLLLTTLILLNKWNHPITHSNLINRSTQRRKWALQNGLEKSSHFVLPFN